MKKASYYIANFSDARKTNRVNLSLSIKREKQSQKPIVVLIGLPGESIENFEKRIIAISKGNK